MEDDINEFLKLEETVTEISTESDNKYNKSWIKAAKDRGRWTLLDNDYIKTAEERSENNVRQKRNTQSRPARYVNGVTLSGGIKKERFKSQKWQEEIWKAAAAASHVAGTSKGPRSDKV